MIKKLLLASVVVGLLGFSRPAYAAGRVSLSPTPVNLTEGQSQVVTVTLDEPIIAQEGEAFVTLNITSTNPSRLTTSVASVAWTGAQWNQSRTFTLAAIDDLLVNGDVNDIVDVSVDSNSEYYSGFQPAFVVNVLDNDVISPVITPTVLPSVGSAINRDIFTILLATLVSTASYWLLARYRHQT